MSRPTPRSPRIRLVAFDLDGTLLGPDLVLPGRLLAAVERLRSSGITAVIVTGRMPFTAERYALQLGLEGLPLVSFNGAMAKAAGRDEVLWYDPIDTPLAAEVVTFLAGRGLEPLVFEGDRLYTGTPVPRTLVYSRISGVEPHCVGDLLKWLWGAGDGVSPRGRVRPAKMLQVEEVEAMPELLSAASARFGDTLNVTTSYPFFLEFMNRQACKGVALARLAEHLGVDRSEVAAFGDGLNDLEMIKWAGLGVAMGHGSPELLAAADRVIQGPPGDGVAAFLEEHIPLWVAEPESEGG